MKAPRIGSVWQHFKGHIYYVMAIGKHSETQEQMVAYMDDQDNVWFRPLSMWHEEIDRPEYKGPRFVELKKEGGSSGTVKPVFTATTKALFRGGRSL